MDLSPANDLKMWAIAQIVPITLILASVSIPDILAECIGRLLQRLFGQHDQVTLQLTYFYAHQAMFLAVLIWLNDIMGVDIPAGAHFTAIGIPVRALVTMAIMSVVNAVVCSTSMAWVWWREGVTGMRERLRREETVAKEE